MENGMSTTKTMNERYPSRYPIASFSSLSVRIGNSIVLASQQLAAKGAKEPLSSSLSLPVCRVRKAIVTQSRHCIDRAVSRIHFKDALTFAGLKFFGEEQLKSGFTGFYYLFQMITWSFTSHGPTRRTCKSFLLTFDAIFSFVSLRASNDPPRDQEARDFVK